MPAPDIPLSGEHDNATTRTKIHIPFYSISYINKYTGFIKRKCVVLVGVHSNSNEIDNMRLRFTLRSNQEGRLFQISIMEDDL